MPLMGYDPALWVWRFEPRKEIAMKAKGLNGSFELLGQAFVAVGKELKEEFEIQKKSD